MSGKKELMFAVRAHVRDQVALRAVCPGAACM
jgi:hypothetical protein